MRVLKHFAIAAATVGMVATLGLAKPATAGDYDGNFMVRLQGTYLNTDDSTKSVTINGVPAAVRGETPDLYLPTATLTYFFNKNFAAELFCCFAKTHVDLFTPAGKLGVGNAAETWLFPPIVTFQYHFTGLGAFKPYVGAGFQWIHYFNSGVGDNVLGMTNVKFSDSFGPAVQAGVDVQLGGGWYANVDVKKTWLDTTITWTDNVGTRIVAKHDLDPLTISVGVGYRFNLFGPRDIEPLK